MTQAIIATDLSGVQRESFSNPNRRLTPKEQRCRARRRATLHKAMGELMELVSAVGSVCYVHDPSSPTKMRCAFPAEAELLNNFIEDLEMLLGDDGEAKYE